MSEGQGGKTEREREGACGRGGEEREEGREHARKKFYRDMSSTVVLCPAGAGLPLLDKRCLALLVGEENERRKTGKAVHPSPFPQHESLPLLLLLGCRHLACPQRTRVPNAWFPFHSA